MKYIIALVLVVIVVLAQSGCTDEKEAERILTANGFSDITYTGHAWFACDEKDTYATGFVAKSPTGVKIEGAVCSGLFFKNSTIRFK